METELAAVEYVGLAGQTRSCVQAVERLIQYGDNITEAYIISFGTKHGLILLIDNVDYVVVKSGFASGYGGEGPRGFSYVIQLLDFHAVEITEYIVSEEFFSRLNHSRLTWDDVTGIEGFREVRPSRWRDYIFEHDRERKNKAQLWRSFPPVIPLAIVDERVVDLALSFWDDPDKKLLTAYRRLEDSIRTRTGLREHGSKLFAKAFSASKPYLCWPFLDSSEQIARFNLILGAFGAYRNPRAHRERKENHNNQLAEFMLANHLFHLEREAQEAAIDEVEA